MVKSEPKKKPQFGGFFQKFFRKPEKNQKEQRLTVQRSIPYLEMGRDGICRVEEHLYSKTVRFYDINYQLAQNEDKNTIFESWCDFLNYFDASIRFQLSFINHKSDMSEYNKVIQIEPQHDAFDDVRMEYAPQSIRRKISIVGPTANVALSGICFILYVLIGHDVLFWVSMESLILGMVNFLPFPGLDGNKFLSSFASKGESVLSISNIDFIAVGGCVAAGFATYVCAKMMPLWLAFVTTEVVMLVVAMAVSSNAIANFFLWGWICAIPIGYSMADLFCTIDYESPFRRICVITLTALIAAAFSNMSVAVVNYFVDDM